MLSFEAKWRAATRPKSRSQQAALGEALTTPEQRERANSEAARQKWKRVGEIARRAGADDADYGSETDDDDHSEGLADYRKKRIEERAAREKTAKMMDLQYFLEMVDVKHRYGSNLRAYHEQWKKADTNENFYYWLDYGDGKKFEHPTVSRERLEKEQVRYLSREERLNYLVKVDDEGRLCWVKNGERINTTVEFKDSVNGVVPKDDDTPAFGPNGQLHSGQSKNLRSGSVSSSSSDTGSEHSDVEGEHYVNEDLGKAKGVSKLKHVSAATVLNHLLRGSVKPNSWIFVSLCLPHRFITTHCALGCGHIISPVHWHQAVRRVPAQLVSTWRAHFRCRFDQNQGWTTPPPLSSIWPLSATDQEFPRLCTFNAREWRGHVTCLDIKVICSTRWPRSICQDPAKV
jgi:hypothetical protein